MNVIDAPQGSPEWFLARAGKVTASRISDVMSKGRGGEPSATRASYMGELISEILTGQPQPIFMGNVDTERGIQTEPEARSVYEVVKDTMVSECGFVLHPTIERAGASPDGLVGQDGLIEIKCPRPHIHTGYWLSGIVPSKYISQMTWQLACTERKWCDFVSYCPAMPEDMRLLVVRYQPSAAYLTELDAGVRAFLKDMEDLLGRIAERRSAA